MYYSNFIKYIINNEQKIRDLYFISKEFKSDLEFKKLFDNIGKSKILNFIDVTNSFENKDIIDIQFSIKHIINIKNDAKHDVFHLSSKVNIKNENKNNFINYIYFLKNQILNNNIQEITIPESNKFIYYSDGKLYIKWDRDYLEKIRINSYNEKYILEQLDNLIKLIL
uniref:Uncharacterized protein n=1 Tax=viral metagenome TaxID=1070528 RepID=A0A6C0AF63_9ZZZZ